MTELDKLKIIEKCFERALEEIWTARKIIRTIEDDYNTIYPEGLDKFVSQLGNYYRDYKSEVNTLIRKMVDNKVVKKGGE